MNAISGSLVAPDLRKDRDTLLSERRRRFETVCTQAGLDSWILTTSTAVRFVTGYSRETIDLSGEFAYPITAVGDDVMVDLPPRSDVRFVEALLERIPQSGRVGLDAIGIEAFRHLALARPDVQFVPVNNLMQAASQPMSEVECAVIREGQKLTEQALAASMKDLQPGMTEREASAVILDSAMRVGLTEPHIDQVCTVIPIDRHPEYADWDTPLPLIPRDDTLIGEGDLLTIDLGFRHEGYMTDLGWTFVVGASPTDAQEKLAQRWTEVAQRVMAAVRPHGSAAELTLAALQGWHESRPPWPEHLWISHTLGFLGMTPPFAGTTRGIEADAAMTIRPGTFVVIEPYIWEKGVGGFRAEITVEVIDGGSRRITELPVEELVRVPA